MLELLKNEAFLNPVAAILALLVLLSLLKSVNKIILIVGIVVVTMVYFLNNRPAWLENLWAMFQL